MADDDPEAIQPDTAHPDRRDNHPGAADRDRRDEAESFLRALAGPAAQLREDQWTAIRALVEDGRRALVVQRTGWGKSAVYFTATALLRARGAGPSVRSERTSGRQSAPWWRTGAGRWWCSAPAGASRPSISLRPPYCAPGAQGRRASCPRCSLCCATRSTPPNRAEPWGGR